MKNSEYKRDCPFYTWGGNANFDWPTAPSEYGAICHLNETVCGDFDCSTCKVYEPAKKLAELVEKKVKRDLTNKL